MRREKGWRSKVGVPRLLSRDRKERSRWSQFAFHFWGCLETQEAYKASQSANGWKGSSLSPVQGSKKKCACFTSLLSLSPKPHPTHLTVPMSSVFPWCFFWRECLFLLAIWHTPYRSRSISNGTQLFPGSPTQSQKRPAFIFAHITYISIWLKRNSRLKNPNRHFNSPTNCSIYSLPFFRLNQRDSECISYFFQRRHKYLG